MKVFKVPGTKYFDPAGRRCKKTDAVVSGGRGRETLRPGFQKKESRTKKYYGYVPDNKGGRKKVPLSTDKKVSEEILAKLITDATKARHGLGDPFQEHRSTPLSKHLEDFEKDLEVKAGTVAHRKQVVSRLTKAFKACGFETVQELAGPVLAEWLAAQRRGGRERVTLPSKKELFTVREVSALFDVKPDSVRAIVQRHGLEANGQGKARRFPRATVEFLHDRLCRGVSMQTSNYFIKHAIAFGRFLVKEKRIAENPFAHVKTGRTEVDRRHDRRELSADELSRLIATTQASTRLIRDLDGTARAMLYAVAASTGFRASALASLTPESFLLDEEPPVIVLAARFNKNRFSATLVAAHALEYPNWSKTRRRKFLKFSIP